MSGCVQSVVSAINRGLYAEGVDTSKVVTYSYFACACFGAGVYAAITGIQDIAKGKYSLAALKCTFSIIIIAKTTFDFVHLWNLLLSDIPLTLCRSWQASPRALYEQTCSPFRCTIPALNQSSTCARLIWGPQFHDDTKGRGFLSLEAMMRGITDDQPKV